MIGLHETVIASLLPRRPLTKTSSRAFALWLSLAQSFV